MATIATQKTITKAHSVTTHNVKTETTLFQRIFGNLEGMRFGIVPAALIWTACLGSIAVGLGAVASIPLLMAIVFPTMALLAFCLAVQPVKTILWIALTSTLIDLAIIGLLLLA